MKPYLLLLLTLLPLRTSLSAEAKKTDPSAQIYGGISIKEDSTLKKLLLLPDIATQYKNCQGVYPNPKELSKIPDCLWNGDGKNIPALKKAQKDAVKKLYAEEESAGGSKDKVAIDPKASEVDVTAADMGKTTNFTHRSVNIGTDYKSDPAVVALSAFFGKKLDEALNGNIQDKKDKKIVTVDHTKFIDLYTSELGKSIVNSFTAYCMETDPKCRVSTIDQADGKEKFADDKCIISEDPADRKAHIKENLKAINEKANFTESEGRSWIHCIGTVSNVCYDTSKTTDKDILYSRQKACLVMDFVKAGRKNLIISTQQKKFYEGLIGGGERSIASIATNMKVVDNEKDLSADKLTQITSGDIDKDFKNKDNQNENISKTNKKIEEEANDCMGPDGEMTTKNKCAKFLDVNKTKNTEAVTEFGLRQFAKEETLAEKLEEKGTVGSYLKEEGYTEDQVKGLTSTENIEEVKKKIKDRFNAEKNAIIEEMAAKITGKTTIADGSIAKGDKTALGKIKEDLKTRNDDLKNLVHFNNIVASYLNISEGSGKSLKVTRNTASLFAEVNAMDKKDSKDLMDRIKNNKDLKENQTTADFQISDINQILKYKDDQKAPETKKP